MVAPANVHQDTVGGIVAQGLVLGKEVWYGNEVEGEDEDPH